MKKLVSILVLVFAFSLTIQAQKKRKDKRPQLSINQQTQLTVKKMTLVLDLSKEQLIQITPFIKNKVTAKYKVMTKRKEMKKNKHTPSADEIFAIKSIMLDNKIAEKNYMKDILDEEQFEKFEKISQKRMTKSKKMMARKRSANYKKQHNTKNNK